MIRKGMIKLDHFVFSLHPIGEGIFSGLGVHRRWGREPFTPRETRIVHIIMSEVPWAHTVDGLDGTVRESLPELAPRLRTVLGLLV